MAHSFSDRLASLADRYNQRPVRERALMLATALVVLVVVGWELAVVPVQQEHQRLQNRLQALSADADGLLAQRQTLERQLATDPSLSLRNQLSARQQRLDALNRQISDTTSELIAPRAMVSLLQTMLAAQDELALQGLELQKPTPVYAPSATTDGEQEAEPLLYAHEVELRIRGSYLQVLNYLERLEAMDDRLGWVRLHYDAGDWPAGEATIRVRTLSLEQAWLGV